MKRERVGLSIFRRAFNHVFYSILTRLSGLELSGGQSDFRLMNGRRWMRCWACLSGASSSGVWHAGSGSGRSRSTTRYLHVSRGVKIPSGQPRGIRLDGILSFSVVPLRLFMIMGVVISTSAFLYEVFILGSGLYAYIAGSYALIRQGGPRWPLRSSSLAASSF